jgi:hypothetical protein
VVNKNLASRPKSDDDNQGPSYGWETALVILRKDPSLRFTETGRCLLRWLGTQTTGLSRWKDYSDIVPAHCLAAVAELARRNGDAWREILTSLEDG